MCGSLSEGLFGLINTMKSKLVFTVQPREQGGVVCGSPSEDLFGYLHNMMSAGAVLLPTQESLTVPLSAKRIISRIF